MRSSVASIDTIRLTVERPPRMLDAMQLLGFTPHYKHKRREGARVTSYTRNRDGIKFTASLAPDGRAYFIVELSAPKYLYGSNVFTLSTDEAINDFLQHLSKRVSAIVGFKFLAHEANVSRVDYAVNIHRADNDEVRQILRALDNVSLPRMICYRFNTTLHFKNGSQQICLYSKYDEVLREMKRNRAMQEHLIHALGVLRLERRFMNWRACRDFQTRWHLPDMKAKTFLTTEIARCALNETVSELGLDKPIMSNDMRLAVLQEYLSSMKFLQCVGFIIAYETLGSDQLKKIMPPSTFYNMRKQIIDLGVMLSSPDHRTLAPVELGTASQSSNVIPINRASAR